MKDFKLGFTGRGLMKYKPNFRRTKLMVYFPFIATAGFIVFILCVAIACQTMDTSGLETQTALNVEATILAMQSEGETQPTLAAQELTLTAQAGVITRQVEELANQAVKLTEAAKNNSAEITQSQAGAAANTGVMQGAPTPAPLPSLTPTREIDVKEKIKTSNILLYENMAGVFDTGRYVKAALDGLGAKYTDCADLQGRFKEYLLDKAPDKKGWDLIISADETRTHGMNIKGEFFSYFQILLEKDAAVIVETWNMDSFDDQQVRQFLNACGVQYQGDMYDLRYQSQVFYSPEPSNPFLTTPNQTNLANVTNYWEARNDLGDLVEKTSSSQAHILLTRRLDFPDKYGTLTSCWDGRLILQTFSSHQYQDKNMIALWQNYIYNTLKNHYLATEQK